MPTRIQTDRGRGVFRRFGIRTPRQTLDELDSTVYPVTITEPSFSELASLRHQGVNAGTTLGTNWDSFDAAGPISAGQVLAVCVLSRGLFTVGGICDGTDVSALKAMTVELVSPGAVLIAELKFLMQSGAASPLGGGPNRFGPWPLWNEIPGSGLRLVAVEAPAVATRLVGGLWACRHYSDVQDGTE